MALKIGSTELKYGLMLAPMAGVSDRAFRNICVKFGAEYTVTEMVSAKALHFDDHESKRLASIEGDKLPCAIQIFGHEPDIMAEAAAYLTKDTYSLPSAIDINMGCPVRKIVQNGEGSALMRDPVLAGRIIKAVVSASNVPVTVKIRSGWSDEYKNAVEIARVAEENGASLICIHGRTREQMYAPPVDLDIITDVKRAVSIPVIGNGGINTPKDAIEMLERTGCDGLMIARGAMGNPWLFEQIKAAIDKREYVLPPLKDRLEAALLQLDDMVRDKGEHIAALESRRHLSYYIKGIHGSSEARAALNVSPSIEHSKEIIYKFIERNK